MEFVTNLNQKEYDDFVQSHEKSHFLQSYAWGEFSKIAKNLTPYYVGLKDKNKLVASALLLKKSLPFGYSYFYSPRGFVIDFFNESLFKEFHQHIIHFIKEKKGIFLKIDPDLVISKKNYLDEEIKLDYDYHKVFSMLKKLKYHHLGFTKNFELFQPRYSFRIDMNDSLENIEDKFSKTTKQRIKKAIKFEVENYIGSEKDIQTFYDLMLLTEDRKNFVSPELSYYENLYKIYNKDNQMTLYMGKVNLEKILQTIQKDFEQINHDLEEFKDLENLSKSANTKKKELLKRKEKLDHDRIKFNEVKRQYGNEIVLNAHVLLDYGNKTWVVYAANHNVLTETYANYLTYFYHIRTSYEKGIKMYDQFGTVGDLNNKKYIGIHEFKKKFGGDYVEFIGEFDYITKPILYFAFNKLVPLYRNIIKKKARKEVNKKVNKENL